MSARPLTIALAGNPNSGKTTIFNTITGTRQKVGNWPGVTVEKKEGRVEKFGRSLTIIDLPGTYSLTPFSIEEIVARDYILEQRPDVVIDIIDASNLERSLYLATQLRELDCKIVFALNMIDLARSRGVKIDGDKLSSLLDVPVVFTVGNRREGIDALLKCAIALADADSPPEARRRVKYSQDIEASLRVLQEMIDPSLAARLGYNARWTAVKLIEDDQVIKAHLQARAGEASQPLLEAAQQQRRQLYERYNDEPEIITTDERYGYISGIIKEVYTTSTQERVDISRHIDRLLTNRFLGLPIFFLFIWAMFQATFSLGAYPMDWIESAVGAVSSILDHLLPAGMVKALLLDGIVAGVGSVIVFLPNILILFFCIALFEDTGYMSRAAFLMDKVMHLIGLHGKSFIPMLMGFGCNVPAIMATRTLESRKDRILTILITPFMSCSAKLPVYIVLAGTFFGARAGTVIFAIYLAGILLAILFGRLFRDALLKGEDAPFVMELPPYRIPMLKSLLIHMWDRSKMFLRKMGGVILAGSIVIWVLSTFPRQYDTSASFAAQRESLTARYATEITAAADADRGVLQVERDQQMRQLARQQEEARMADTYLGRLGRWIAPVFAPIGIDWRGGVALLTGFVAKEVVVSTMGVLYAVGDDQGSEALQEALRASGMQPISALSMMVFVLLYLPCVATTATIRRETGSVRWMLFSITYTTAVAWLAALLVYQSGRLLALAA
ncbi:MAG: ferrous iron transport protein B [Desulfosarcinaceae bacterium]|nr:ferrous iron transport protein B [Desulfosarcinaceae bacterium]